MHLISELTLRTRLLGTDQSEGLRDRRVPVPFWRLGHVGPELLPVIHGRVCVPTRIEKRAAYDGQIAHRPAGVATVVLVWHNRLPAVAAGAAVGTIHVREIVVEGVVGHPIEVDHVLDTRV